MMIRLLASNFHGAILGESIVVLILLCAVIAIYVLKNRKKEAEETVEPVEEAEEEAVQETIPLEDVIVTEPVQEVAEETAAAEEVPTVTAIVGDEEEEEEDDDGTVEGLSEIFGGKNGTRIILNRSFAAKIAQSNDEVKAWYSDLKNCLLSYKDIKCRKSWKRESYYIKNKCIAKMSVRGKTLCLYVAVQPDKYNDTKYKVEDVSETKVYAITPCMYRMKNARRAKYATQIIAEMLETITVKSDGRQPVDYRPKTETTEELIQKGLIKVVEKKK